MPSFCLTFQKSHCKIALCTDALCTPKRFFNPRKKHSQIDKKYILQSRAFGTHLDQDCGYSQPRFDETVIWLLKEILIIEKDRTYLSNIWEVFLVGND